MSSGPTQILNDPVLIDFNKCEPVSCPTLSECDIPDPADQRVSRDAISVVNTSAISNLIDESAEFGQSTPTRSEILHDIKHCYKDYFLLNAAGVCTLTDESSTSKNLSGTSEKAVSSPTEAEKCIETEASKNASQPFSDEDSTAEDFIQGHFLRNELNRDCSSSRNVINNSFNKYEDPEISSSSLDLDVEDSLPTLEILCSLDAEELISIITLENDDGKTKTDEVAGQILDTLSSECQSDDTTDESSWVSSIPENPSEINKPATVATCSAESTDSWETNKVERLLSNSSEDNNEDINWSWLNDLIESSEPFGQHDTIISVPGLIDASNSDQQLASANNSLFNTKNSAALTTLLETSLNPAETDALRTAFTSPSPLIMPSRRERGNSSWLRESMRRARHFQLSEPTVQSVPLPSSPIRVVDDRNAPLFPCEILERPSSAPAERPRQYGRRNSRPISSSHLSSTGEDSVLSSSQLDHERLPVAAEICQPDARLSIPTCEDRISHSSSSGDSSSSDSEAQPPIVHPSGQQNVQSGTVIRAYELPQVSTSAQGQWSHGLSSLLASLGCTLGLFNISRFAILSVHFGANFIMQFTILSLIIGVPLFTFHVSLGQLLASGVIDMWNISPIFKGIGVGLLISQAMLGTYSIIGVSWMFVYFRDSFITKQDVYRWAESLDLSQEDGLPDTRRTNVTYKLEETVPDYFNGIVLQRQYLVSSSSDAGSIKFSVAFNLAAAWFIIFISLSKGLKSYGKVIYVFSVVPVVGLIVLCAKMLGAAPGLSRNQDFFFENDWSEFFLNTKSWTAAFIEAFSTWGMLGASVMQIASHNKQKNLLPRDTGLVIIITFVVLILTSFLAHTCYQLILAHGFFYCPSSFEKMSTYRFLYLRNSPQPSSHFSTRVQWMAHSGLFVGERVINPSMNPRHESGYQALRFATELVPTTFALLGADKVSPFWSVLFYFVLTMFGIAQQLSIWHCVVSGIVAIDVKTLQPWLTTITFFSCVFAFIIGLPMTSELGIFVVYYLDFCIGSGWWLVLLYLLEIGAVFMVRGRPYSGETVVATLFSHTSQLLQSWVAPMLSFIWNVILPVALMLLSTTIIKNGGYRVLYNWQVPGYDFWPPWGRQAGCLIQLIPLIIVPIVGIIQTFRYLTVGPPDIFERLQLLYRPRIDPQQNIHDMSAQTNLENSNANRSEIPVEDPPPKYTPPPSYSTATGARIAKLLRQSLRRSVRGIRQIRSVLRTPGENHDAYDMANPPESPRRPPPPNYAAVLVEINQSQAGSGSSNRTQTTIPRRNNEVNEIIPRSNFSSNDTNGQSRSGTMTASDVANILRTSLRRTVLRSSSMTSQVSSSVEHLVCNAAPINHDALVLDGKNIKNNSPQSQ